MSTDDATFIESALVLMLKYKLIEVTQLLEIRRKMREVQNEGGST